MKLSKKTIKFYAANIMKTPHRQFFLS